LSYEKSGCPLAEINQSIIKQNDDRFGFIMKGVFLCGEEVFLSINSLD